VTSTMLKRSLMAGTAALMLGGVQAHAAGFYLEDQSTKGSGRAFSGEASDMGAASMWYNPAAIAGITSSEIEGSLTPILVDARVSDASSTIKYLGQPTTPISGTPNAFKPVELGVIPASAFAYRINDQWSVGVAVTSPFSFATKYDDSNVFSRYSGLTTRLTTIDVQPTIAWRPVRWIGIGGGANVEYTNAVLTQALPQLTAGVPDGNLDLHGNNYAVGYNVGVQLHPTDKVVVGLAYRSKINHDLSGLYKIQGLQGLLALANTTGVGTAASASFNTPWSATFGVRWRVTDKLTVEGQGVRFGWSEFSQIALSTPSNLLPNQPENYHDTTSGAVGMDYDLTRRLTLRAGVQYDPTPTTDGSRDSRVPDGDRFLFAGGYSFKVTPNIVLDGAISYIDFIPSHINQTVNQYANVSPLIAIPINTQGEVHANAETLSAGAHFYF
jgi:long-chain fatty acid transport protein